MTPKYIVTLIIIFAISLKLFHFNEPNYVGKWENIELKQRLTILKNNLVIYQFDAFADLYGESLDVYGDWSEMNKNEVLIRYKMFEFDENALFKSNNGEVGYLDNHARTILFTRIEN